MTNVNEAIAVDHPLVLRTVLVSTVLDELERRDLNMG